MELLETKNKKQNQNNICIENQEQDTGSRGQWDQIAKVTITKKAESLMSELATRVNEGFEFGHLSRHQLMSWILTKFAEECSEQDVKAIRADHFDEIALLELSLKRFKQAGALPPELKKLLLTQAGFDDMGKKPPKKAVDNKVHQ